MTDHRQQFAEQQQQLLKKQAQLTSKAVRTVWYQWLLAGVLLGYVIASIYYYTRYSEVFTQWTIDLQILLAIGVGVGSLPIIAFLFVFDFSRSLITLHLALVEKTFDISSGVYAAMSEYLGDELPMYSKHLKNFGLAHESLAIAQDMSRTYERAFAATQLALKTLDEHFGLRNIKHETLKAEVLSDMLTILLETLKDNQDVADCGKADEKIVSLAQALKGKTQELK